MRDERGGDREDPGRTPLADLGEAEGAGRGEKSATDPSAGTTHTHLRFETSGVLSRIFSGKFRLFVGRSDYERCIVFCWGFGWIEDTDLGAIPWRHHGRVRLFRWVPSLIWWRWHRRLPPVPVGFGVCGRWWSLR